MSENQRLQRSNSEALTTALLEVVRLLCGDPSLDGETVVKPAIRNFSARDSKGKRAAAIYQEEEEIASVAEGESKPTDSPKIPNGGPCSHCGTTHSPQWRRPPPKKALLCNACGIYYSRHRSLPKHLALRHQPPKDEVKPSSKTSPSAGSPPRHNEPRDPPVKVADEVGCSEPQANLEQQNEPSMQHTVSSSSTGKIESAAPTAEQITLITVRQCIGPKRNYRTGTRDCSLPPLKRMASL